MKSCPSRKFVFLGCGSVAKCCIDYLDEFFSPDFVVNHDNVIMIDEKDLRSNSSIQNEIKKGGRFLQLRLESGNFESVFHSTLGLKPLDVIIDLTTSTNGLEIVRTCRRMSLILINTSHEIDTHFEEEEEDEINEEEGEDEKKDGEKKKGKERALYDVSLWRRHVDVELANKDMKDDRNATHIYDFGMNPGLISHLVFHGIRQVAEEAVKARPGDEELASYLHNLDYARMARHLGLETIHCSEIDTQHAKNLPETNEQFVNTWSVIGMLEEACEPCQAGWGSHEKKLPPDGHMIGPHHIAIDKPAYRQLHVSWVPDQEIIGVVIGHGESCTLPMSLKADDYAPTMHYVYQMCEQTRSHFKALPHEKLLRVTNWRVLNPGEDDLEGEDRVGALLMFKKNPITLDEKIYTRWTGSILGQGLSKKHGPTAIQVMAGVLTATKYAIENPNKGMLFPEAVPNDFVMKHASPYLGNVISVPTPWLPPSTQFTDLSKLAAGKVAQDPSLI